MRRRENDKELILRKVRVVRVIFWFHARRVERNMGLNGSSALPAGRLRRFGFKRSNACFHTFTEEQLSLL